MITTSENAIVRPITSILFAILCAFTALFVMPDSALAQDETAQQEESTYAQSSNESLDNSESVIPAHTHKLALNVGGGVTGAIIFIPFVLGTGNIQIEYNIVDWFAIGFDLTMGGEISSHAFFVTPLVTAKFMVPLQIADLWAEIGIGGAFELNTEDKEEDSRYEQFSARLKLGATFHITEHFGMGFNVGLSYGTGILGGLDLQYRF